MTQITVTTTIQAPLKQVWKAWTLPEHITGWTFASDDRHCPSASNDLKVGGIFTTRMEAKDGSFGFDFGGTYTQVVDQQLIAYTMDGDDARKVEIHFEQMGDHVKVTEMFDAETENPLEMQQAGRQAILENFKKYVETVSF